MSLVDNLQTIINHVSDSVKSAVAADANTAPAVQSTNNVSVATSNPTPVLANVAPVAVTTTPDVHETAAPVAPPVVTPEVEASVQHLWTVLSDIFNGRKTLEDVIAAEIKGAISKALIQSEWGKEQNDKNNPDSIWNRTQR